MSSNLIECVKCLKTTFGEYFYVGDIVTVTRSNGLVITGRIKSISDNYFMLDTSERYNSKLVNVELEYIGCIDHGKGR